LTLQARFSNRLLGLVFLALLVAGVMVAPFPVTAQEPAPAAQSDPSVQPQDRATPEPARQEEDSVHFRHTSIVAAAARVLHVSVETMARIFEIINFAIIALAIGIPLRRFLPKFLRNRAQKISTDIESARKVTADANARLSAIEAKLSGLGEEIAHFRAEVEKESLQDEARIKAALKEESAWIVAAAELEIGVAAAQATRGLRHFAANLAIEQAGKQLVLTPEIDSALIAEFVGDMAGKVAARGGKN
jgi:F-type H+-transporting ATPase subunit b